MVPDLKSWLDPPPPPPQQTCENNHRRQWLVMRLALAAVVVLSALWGAQPASAQTPLSCADSEAVPDPESADLIADCEALLASRDTLVGTGNCAELGSGDAHC